MRTIIMLLLLFIAISLFYLMQSGLSRCHLWNLLFVAFFHINLKTYSLYSHVILIFSLELNALHVSFTIFILISFFTVVWILLKIFSSESTSPLHLYSLALRILIALIFLQICLTSHISFQHILASSSVLF